MQNLYTKRGVSYPLDLRELVKLPVGQSLDTPGERARKN